MNFVFYTVTLYAIIGFACQPAQQPHAVSEIENNVTAKEKMQLLFQWEPKRLAMFSSGQNDYELQLQHATIATVNGCSLSQTSAGYKKHVGCQARFAHIKMTVILRVMSSFEIIQTIYRFINLKDADVHIGAELGRDSMRATKIVFLKEENVTHSMESATKLMKSMFSESDMDRKLQIKAAEVFLNVYALPFRET
nr:unnamed protein product [Spirometra erinaceieuropaei]